MCVRVGPSGSSARVIASARRSTAARPRPVGVLGTLLRQHARPALRWRQQGLRKVRKGLQEQLCGQLRKDLLHLLLLLACCLLLQHHRHLLLPVGPQRWRWLPS